MKQFFTKKYIPVHVGLWGVIWGNFMYQISKIEDNNMNNNKKEINYTKLNKMIDKMENFVL
tara:strand:+ start:49 stop:231 length:183 start_codon:yes stop_codon:yes gene_type:complete